MKSPEGSPAQTGDKKDYTNRMLRKEHLLNSLKPLCKTWSRVAPLILFVSLDAMLVATAAANENVLELSFCLLAPAVHFLWLLLYFLLVRRRGIYLTEVGAGVLLALGAQGRFRVFFNSGYALGFGWAGFGEVAGGLFVALLLRILTGRRPRVERVLLAAVVAAGALLFFGDTAEAAVPERGLRTVLNAVVLGTYSLLMSVFWTSFDWCVLGMFISGGMLWYNSWTYYNEGLEQLMYMLEICEWDDLIRTTALLAGRCFAESWMLKSMDIQWTYAGRAVSMASVVLWRVLTKL